MLQSQAGKLFTRTRGEIVDVPDADAIKMDKAGVAVIVGNSQSGPVRATTENKREQIVVIEATRGAIEYADAKGINLERSGIQGSGKGGRITLADVQGYNDK